VRPGLGLPVGHDDRVLLELHRLEQLELEFVLVELEQLE
jgi:hypothetical protein